MWKRQSNVLVTFSFYRAWLCKKEKNIPFYIDNIWRLTLFLPVVHAGFAARLTTGPLVACHHWDD